MRTRTEILLDTFTEIATERSKRMSDEEFKSAIEGSRKIINRVCASGRRGARATSWLTAEC
jgi:hypothetical protein